MKKLLFILFFFSFVFSGFSQELLKKKLNLLKSSYTTKELIQELIHHNNLNIFYNADDIDTSIRYSFRSGNLSDIIRQINEYNNLDTKIIYDQIVFKKKKKIVIKRQDTQEPLNVDSKTNSQMKLKPERTIVSLPALCMKEVEYVKISKEMKTYQDKNFSLRKSIITAALVATMISNNNAFSQSDSVKTSRIKIVPYVMSGYISHLRYTGINTEFGTYFESKRLEWGLKFRQVYLSDGNVSTVTIIGLGPNFAFKVLNKEHHKFKIGSGIEYGKYKRYSNWFANSFEKAYNFLTLEYVRLKYEYRIKNYRIGLFGGLYSDDGDATGIICLEFGVEL